MSLIYEVDIQESIEKAFIEYGASVAQERSIIDVRDGLKIGLRQGLYAQYCNKLTHKNRFQKAQKSVSAATSQSYVHGDAAMYSTFIRAAKPWAYSYPLETAQGSYGTQCGPDTESASRYVEMKASELADVMFDGLKKHCIDEYYKNYDDTEDIPSVFPSIGFWNVVNGSTGIAVGMSTSVPQFNLKEVNNALIKLIKNPDSSFEDIYCPPDFCCGGTILNANEVKESIRNGKGKSIRLRAKVVYDAKLHALKITNLPYGVYTDTVINEIGVAVEKDQNYGIEKVTDHTKQFADIWVYLTPGVNPSIIERKLYKDTSIESFFAINMLMLDNGRTPKVFGWKAACEAYIKHIRDCKRRELEYDKNVLVVRNHILDGLLVALANIDEVIALIRNSESAEEAKNSLMSNFELDEEQAKAILDIKLQRLAHLEAIKINAELNQNYIKIDELNDILSNQEEMDTTLIEKLVEVSNRFGVDRKTKLTNLLQEEENEEDIVPVMLRIYNGKITVTQKKLAGIIIETTNVGKVIGILADGTIKKVKVSTIADGAAVENIFGKNLIAAFDADNTEVVKYIYFLTKNGYFKKTRLMEFSTLGFKPTKALKLKDNDEIIYCSISNEDKQIEIKTAAGQKKLIQTSTIDASGKIGFGTLQIKNDTIKSFTEKKV